MMLRNHEACWCLLSHTTYQSSRRIRVQCHRHFSTNPHHQQHLPTHPQSESIDSELKFGVLLDEGLDETAPNLETLASLLKRCGQAKALCEGKLLHNHIIKRGLHNNIYLANWLVKMYGDCASMDEAKSVFDKLPSRNSHSWTILVNAYAKNGFAKEALEFFDRMQVCGFKPNDVSFVCALDACCRLGNLRKGREIHAAVVDHGYEHKVVVGTALLNMYGKCGSVDDARHVFMQMPHRNIMSWSAMIDACSKNGHCEEALDLFERMQSLAGLQPDRVTFLSALDACAGLCDLRKTRSLHRAIIENGYEKHIVMSTALINTYGKCRSLEDARRLFIQMSRRDVVTWNAMIGACAQNGKCEEALDLLKQMQGSGVKPDRVTFICALEACNTPDALEMGRGIHAAIVEGGFERDVVVATSLVDMYGKCGSVKDALVVFDKMHNRNVVSWNAMIAACNQNGQSEEALDLISDMEQCGFKLDPFTLVCGLDACANLASLKQGVEFHASIKKEHNEADVVVGNALVNMYAKCGNFGDAWSVFSQMRCRDIVSWNAIITACGQHGEGEKALSLFNAMQYEGFKPNTVTLNAVLAACSHTGCVFDAKQFFDSINAAFDVMVEREHCVSMIDILSRAGHLHDAETLIKNIATQEGA